MQLLERAVPDFELNAFRTATSLSVHVLVLLYKKEWPRVPRSETVAVSATCFLSAVIPLMYYISVTFLPLTSAETLKVTTCTASGVPLFAIFIQEKITVKRLLFAVLCICGIFLVDTAWVYFQGGGVFAV